ncbi:MAG: hypothetical protein ABSD67_15430 [Terracidiphilus sp.]|jgi:hypothetical protein
MGKKRTVKTKAWLVTWEWCGDHAKREDIFAAVLNPRFSTQKICEIVELMHRLAEYSLSDQAGYARNKSPNHRQKRQTAECIYIADTIRSFAPD